MRRLAMLSLHTSPLAQPGVGDSGGMNVYVRELAAALARAGNTCDVFTRAWSPALPPVVEVEPGFSVYHVPAGPRVPMPKEELPGVVEEFTEAVLAHMGSLVGSRQVDGAGPYQAVHANYWLSGLSGHVIKHRLDLPLVSTFHTLDRVKAEAGPEEVQADVAHRRAEAEAAVIACSDTVLASCTVEADQIADLYPAEPARIQVVAPGVDHAFFAPGYRPQARRALGLPAEDPLLLFVGRIQPLKRADLAVEALAELVAGGIPARLALVGGPSGPHGQEASDELDALVGRLGLAERVRRIPPQPHELLSSYYRAADVTLVPSRSESFGLVALESAACGTPVVASDVGGLRTLVDPGRTGELVETPTAQAFAEAVAGLLSEPQKARRFSAASVLRARRYTWRSAAIALTSIYDELVPGHLVQC